MAETLRISSALTLPIDAVTQRQAFLGKPGSGKTYAAMKEAELMYDAGAQFVAIDPVGVWYGLRVDGKGKGLPIPVFGGLHGDVPLEPTSGALIADLVVDRRLTCVLDISQFEHDTDKARFCTGFIDRFFFRMKAAPSAVHLFLEECQETVPQNPQRGEERMTHGFIRASKLGRNFGIGISLISQRPQEINKKALNLTECLFAFQMTGVHERKAIRDWVHTVGADENILELLPALPVAHAHVYSPQWLQVSKTVKIAEKRTADVSSTPAVGVSAAQGKPLTPVDLAQIREQVAATIEKAKADDPVELHKEITRLRREIAQAHAEDLPQFSREGIDAEIAEAVLQVQLVEERQRTAIMRSVQQVRLGVAATLDHLTAGTTRLSEARDNLEAIMDANVIEDGSRVRSLDRPRAPVSAPVPLTRSSSAPSPTKATREVPAGANGVTRPQQRMLNAIAQLAAIGVTPAPRTTVAAMSIQSPTSSGFEKNMSTLRTAGLIHYPDAESLALTEQGEATADPGPRRMSLADLHASIRDLVSGPQWRMCEALLSVYPDAMDRGALAAQSNQSATSSGFEKNLSTLRTLGFITYPSSTEAVATSLLRPRGLR
jgi:hypothetical protein